ncbi:hypothetical protein GCM10022631_29970 [Deinococcus rubellus]|uniref:hypothetical protein n=1 Tax=Deinococcus rubellus TaxID=1889240 RepID=UPI0031EC4BC5
MKYGFYHNANHAPGSIAAQKAAQRTALIRAAGFGCNLMFLSHLGDAGFSKTLLSLAATRGMTLTLEDVVGSDLTVLQTLPNFIHAVCDDANRQPLGSVQAMAGGSRVARRYISIGPGIKTPCVEYFSCTEDVGVQSYPFPTESLWASWLVWSAARVNADKAGVQAIGNSQLHALDEGQPRPTPEQIRAQTWVAAAAGLDGLLGYSLLDAGGPLPVALEMAFVSACQEVSGLTAGRPLKASVVGNLLTASWAGGVSVTVDLEKCTVVKLKTRF